MAGISLQGFVLLLPNDGVTPNINAIRSEVHRSIDYCVKITQHIVEDQNTPKKYVHYEEFMYKADINFGPIHENEILKQNLLGRFCEENILSGIGDSWLYLDTFEIKQMIHHSKPNLTSFAFGSIVHMNTFFEHYNSSWSVDDKSCRITQPTVHFKHDVRKLQINFMVTDKKVKTKAMKDLDSSQLHMLELDYSMVLRILIEVEKQPKGKKIASGVKAVRLYLIMNGAPLVKIREVINNEGVEGKNDKQTSTKEAFKGWNDVLPNSENSLTQCQETEEMVKHASSSDKRNQCKAGENFMPTQIPENQSYAETYDWTQTYRFTNTEGPDHGDLQNVNQRLLHEDENTNWKSDNIHRYDDDNKDPKGYGNVDKLADLMHTTQSKPRKYSRRGGNQHEKSFHGAKQNFNSDYRDRGVKHYSGGGRGNRRFDNDFNDKWNREEVREMKQEEREIKKSYVSAAVADDKMVYRRTACFGKENTTAHCSNKIIGMCRVLRLDIRSPADNDNEVWETITQLVCCCREAQVYFTSMKQHVVHQEQVYPSINNLYFDCVYALKTITTPSYTIVDEINLTNNVKGINSLLNKFAEIHPKALEKTLFEIQTMCDKGDLFRFKSALNSLFQQNVKYLESTELRKSHPENTVLLRRAIITPTRTVLLPPIVHMKSYLLRNTDPNFALRVTIRDDNFDQLTYTMKGTPENQNKFLKDYIGSKLLKGFKIGKREYQFFGSSTSQLREHGCLFYAKDYEGNTAETIRKGLGDLQEIKNVAKYMARMGQSLSQAINSIILPEKFVIGPVPDVEYNGYVFSDGIGKISKQVAEKVYKQLGLERDDKPCAMQIRYAGCKGMLLVDPTLEGECVVIRESMSKFKSKNDSLEILKISRPQPAYLNRPFVTILEQMGIPKEAFFKLQTSQLKQIIHSLYNSPDAVSMLKDESVLRLPFKALHDCGIDLAMEPFFRPMVMALYRKTIGLLKSKCRIKLPFSEARTMFGVMDETNTLSYGQVFVQYTNDYKDGKLTKEATVLEGTILVTKNPCMHPGDVRKFTAVHVKDLMHVRDCIVFPAKGPRPHPDEMAGSDLDGDEYCVIWYQDLIFGRENHEAMDYSNDAKHTIVDNIQVKDMVSFICDYIRDDCVGLIASAHLGWADTIGIFDTKCMSIAKKYSVTLDFAKTGKTDKLDKNERIFNYPDFMEKFREKDCYLSTKAMGYLFRNCKHIETISNILSSEIPVEIDPVLVYHGWEEYEHNAHQSLDEYIHLFSTPTRFFFLTNEGEIMAGAVKKLKKTFQGKNIEKNIAKILETVIPHVMKKMKQEFYMEFVDHTIAQTLIQGNKKPEQMLAILSNYAFSQFKETSNGMKIEYNDLLKQMLKKASAWYKVAYESKKEGSTLYLGLPWVVPELMGLLYAKNKLNNAVQKPKLQDKINLFLQSEKRTIETVLGEKPSKDAVELGDQIMMKWLKENGKFLRIRNINMKSLEKELRSQINMIKKGNDVLNTTTDKLLFMYFTKLADFYATIKFQVVGGTQQTADQYWVEKELGLLAIVALSSLSSTGKLWDSELQPGSDSPYFLGLAFLTKEFREEIRFPLDPQGPVRGKPPSEFRKILTENTTEMADLLQRQTKLRSLKIDFKETIVGNRWYILMSVYGNTFQIESLKDIIVQPAFPSKLVKAIKDDCCIM